MSILDDNNTSGQEKLSGWLSASQDQLVVVIFYAEWAGSAQLLRGYMGQFEKDNDEIQVNWIDVDHHKALASQLNVSQIPTILVINQREVVDIMVGVLSRTKLQNRIKQLMKS